MKVFLHNLKRAYNNIWHKYDMPRAISCKNCHKATTLSSLSLPSWQGCSKLYPSHYLGSLDEILLAALRNDIMDVIKLTRSGGRCVYLGLLDVSLCLQQCINRIFVLAVKVFLFFSPVHSISN